MAAIIGALRAELSASTAKFVEDLGKARKELGQTGKAFKKLGKELEDLGKAWTTGITLPITAVVGGLALLAQRTAQAGDAIAKQAQEAGLATDAYQELTFAIGQLADVTDERVRIGLNSLNQRLGQAAQASGMVRDRFIDLGFSARDLASGSVTAEQAVDALIGRLQRTRNAAEASAIAAAVLGEDLGRRLGPAIRASGGDIAALRQQFRALGLGMDEEALEAAERFQDEMDVLRRQVSRLALEVGEELLPVIADDFVPFVREELIPVARDLAAMVAGVVRGFADLPRPVQLSAAGLTGLLAVAGPTAFVLGALTKSLVGAAAGLRAFMVAGGAMLGPAGVPAMLAALQLLRRVGETELEGLRRRAADLRHAIERGFATREMIEDFAKTSGRIMELERAAREAAAATKALEAQLTTLGRTSRDTADADDRFATKLSEVRAAAQRLAVEAEHGDEALTKWNKALEEAAAKATEAAAATQRLALEAEHGDAALNRVTEAEERLHRAAFQLNATLEEVIPSVTDAAAALQRLAAEAEHGAGALELERAFAEGQRVVHAFNVETEDARRRMEALEAVGRDVGAILGRGLQGIAVHGRPAREVLQGIAQDLQALIFRLTVIAALEQAIGGLFRGFGAGASGGGSIIGHNIGGMQHGGTLAAFQPAVVGEAGPELFIPRTAGMVIPNDRLGGITINVDARGAGPGVGIEIRRELMALEARAVRQSVAAVVDEQRRGGAFRSVMG